jgi:hypothetical protein
MEVGGGEVAGRVRGGKAEAGGEPEKNGRLRLACRAGRWHRGGDP